MFEFSKVKGIIFDLDDTLVKTSLDFGLLKKQIDCPSDADILTYIDELSCPNQQKLAANIVLQHELDDARSSKWMPGAKEFVQAAAQEGLPLAIVTRNCKAATELKVKQNAIPIECIITREDAPPKPDPTALLIIAAQWQMTPSDLAYIGDYIYDIQAAHNGQLQAWLFDDKYSAPQSTAPQSSASQSNSSKQSLAHHIFAQKLRYIAPICGQLSK